MPTSDLVDIASPYPNGALPQALLYPTGLAQHR